MNKRSMRITILCVGSRGDVQPYIALGTGLKSAGHEVTIGTHEDFQQFVLQEGLGFSNIEGNIQEIIQSEAGHQWLDSNRNPIRFFTGIVRLVKSFIDSMNRDALKACDNAEAIVFSPLALCAHSIVEKKKVPACMAALQPLSPTTDFASPMFPQYRLGKLYNLLTHFMARQFVWQPFRKHFNRWRREDLQLPSYGFWGPLNQLQKENFPLLYGFSPLVISKPQDWRSGCHLTGYWFLDQPNYQPSEDLLKFLNAGPPPVYIGFGSMSERDPRGLSRLLIRALELAGQRGVILSGWARLPKEDLPENVFVLDSIPHDWLFPKMAAVVHHGGAGTTAAVFRAGVPNVVVPFFADQHFWAAHVFRLGVGPRAIPRKELTAENLSLAIQQAVSSASIRSRAEEFGHQIRKEAGVKHAVEIMEEQVLRF